MKEENDVTEDCSTTPSPFPTKMKKEGGENDVERCIET